MYKIKCELAYAQFINDNITAFQNSNMSFDDLLKIINYTKITIDGEELTFYYFKYCNKNSKILDSCYSELETLDTYKEGLSHFEKILDYFKNILNFQVAVDINKKYFNIDNNKLTSATVIFLSDPFLEDDDGIELLIYDGYDKREVYKMIEELFDIMFERYFKELICIYNKKFSEHSKHEKQIIHMLII